jgi:serine/threonine-protein kinase
VEGSARSGAGSGSDAESSDPPVTLSNSSDPTPDRVPALEYGDLSTAACRKLELALGGRYMVERAIGRGGMATVYLATDARYQRRVAIKILHPALSRELGMERFLREIGIAARLQHPHIVPLHDSGDAGGMPYYVMPFIEGESLRDQLARERQLPMERVLAITRDIAAALDHAHSHGVIHRDIKPGNVLLRENAALIADFGVAWAVEAGESERLTSSGLVLGTPAYMSPEQAAGARQVDGRSDVYALACVVYEMIAGEPPFGGSHPQAVFAKHLQAPVPKLSVVRPTVSDELQQVVETGLAKVAADRFESAGKFASALEAAATSVRPPRLRRIAVAAGFAALATAGALLLRSDPMELLGAGAEPAAAAPESPRIAVLYFDDLSPDSTLRSFADGLTEALIHELSGVTGFRVVSRHGVSPYRGRRVPLDSMVAALRVNTLVDGSVQRSGDRLRVRAQLMDARSNTYVDSLSLEQPISDPMAQQTTVARALAAALRRQMGREIRLRGAGAGTGNGPARELAVRAQRAREDAATLAAEPHAADLRTAIDALGRADSLLLLAQRADTGWLRPLIDRGWVAYDRARLQSGDARIGIIRRAMPLADEAVRRAPTSPEALELRGTLRWQLVTELQASPDDPDRLGKVEEDLRAALDRDSTRTTAWAMLSDLLWFKGSTAEADLAARRALREDTFLANALGVYTQLFFNDLMLGEFARAAEWCQRGRLTFPNDWRFVECELTLMRHDVESKPDPRRAWALVTQLERLDPAEKARAQGRRYHTIYRPLVAATISARAGRHDIARAEITRARRAAEGDSVLSMDLNYDEAYLRLVLGEPARAAELLRDYVEARPMARAYLARDPLLRDLPFTGDTP